VLWLICLSRRRRWLETTEDEVLGVVTRDERATLHDFAAGDRAS
jgi:hypothetical protein